MNGRVTSAKSVELDPLQTSDWRIAETLWNVRFNPA